MKFTNLSGIGLLFALTILSCKKNAAPNNATVDIYIAGDTGPADTNSIGTYWKNGVPVNISGENVINSIAVRGDDIYLLGGDGGYWKNGVYTSLPGISASLGLFVSGTDVYVVGYEYPENINDSTPKPYYWKNRQRIALSPSLPIISAATFSVFVSGGDAYVAGFIGVTPNVISGVYWKNGNIVYLPDASTAEAIAVSGNDVYVAGNTLEGTAAYWLNGVEHILNSLGSSALVGPNSILLSGSDVYIAGFIENDQHPAVYWKNGEPVLLPGGSQATSIALSGSDIYVSGVSSNGLGAVYWKNGIIDSLGMGGATAIEIVSR